MKKLIHAIAILMVISVSFLSQKTQHLENKPAEVVLATIIKWADAVRDRNIKTLDQLFAEGL